MRKSHLKFANSSVSCDATGSVIRSKTEYLAHINNVATQQFIKHFTVKKKHCIPDIPL